MSRTKSIGNQVQQKARGEKKSDEARVVVYFLSSDRVDQGRVEQKRVEEDREVSGNQRGCV